DLLLRIDQEHRAHRIHLVVRGMHHPVEVGDLLFGIGNDREVGRLALGLLDVLRPALVRRDRVDRQTDRLHVALVEFRLEPRDVAELGRAHGREVARMREEDGPARADPVVEFDLALRGVRGEIGSDVSEPQRHANLLSGRGAGARPAARTMTSANAGNGSKPRTRGASATKLDVALTSYT